MHGWDPRIEHTPPLPLSGGWGSELATSSRKFSGGDANRMLHVSWVNHDGVQFGGPSDHNLFTVITLFEPI